MKCLLAASTLAMLALTTVAGVQMNGFVSPSAAPSSVGPPPVRAPTDLWNATLLPSSAIGYGVVFKGSYFVQAQNTGNQNVTLYAFDAVTGRPQWNVSSPSSTGLYVAAGGDYIYAGTLTTLTAYKPENGHVAWTYTTTPDMHSPNLSPDWPGKPTYLNGAVYVTWYNTPMVALDAANGSVLFKTPYYVGGRIWTDGEESGRNVGTNLFFMRQDPVTTRYSSSSAKAATGNLRWNHTWEATGNFDTCVANSHGFASRVFSKTNDSWGKNIFGIDKETGNPVWVANGTDISASGGFDYNIMNDRVCMILENSKTTYILACYNIKNGALQWAVNLPTLDNTVNLAAGDNFVMAYDFNSGRMFAYDYNGNPTWYTVKKNPWYGTLSTAGVYYFGHYDAAGNAILTAVQN